MKLFLKIAYLETFYEDFLEIEHFPASIGRGPANKISLMGHEISQSHAEIIEREGKVFVIDRSSRSGIWEANNKLQEIEIKEGTHVRMGHALLSFSYLQFPLEQTISNFDKETILPHEPLTKRLEAVIGGRFIWVLIAAMVVLSLFTEPDAYRKADYIKKLTYSVLLASFLVPFLINLLIILFRKVNRGDYDWHRSLAMAYILCIGLKLVSLVESSFCWFSTFAFFWNSTVLGIIFMSLFFYWWFWAIGRNLGLKNRILKSLSLAMIVYVLIIGGQYLATGYQSEFEIETCDSITGWHFGEGNNLSTIEDFLNKSAEELGKNNYK